MSTLFDGVKPRTAAGTKKRDAAVHEARPVGRPSKYTPEVAESICERLATSKDGLDKVVRSMGLTPSRVWEWMRKDPEFRERYVHARAFQSELLFDDMLEIASAPMTHNGNPIDDEEEPGTLLEGAAAFAETNRRKMLIDTIKFILVHLQPKRFGKADTQPVVKAATVLTPDQFAVLLMKAKEAGQKRIEAQDIDHEEM